MPPRRSAEENRQKIRHAILDAARELFAERGVEAVTMREIARRVGYSATALYLHFKDKESLLRELCDTDFLSLAQGLQTISQVVDPVARLRQLGLGYIQFAVTHPNHYRLMFMTPRPGFDPEISRIEAGNPQQDAYAQLKLMTEEAHTAGMFRSDIEDAGLIAQTLWAGVHGVCALEIAMKNDCWVDWRALEARVNLMTDALLRGLLREPARG